LRDQPSADGRVAQLGTLLTISETPQGRSTEFSGECIVLCHEVEHSRPGLLILCEHPQQLVTPITESPHSRSSKFPRCSPGEG
jgi:hypothetical protein